MKLNCLMMLIFMTLVAPVALGQPGTHEPLESALYPVELIMQNQKRIELTDVQRDKIKAEMDRSQKLFRDAEWDLRREVESMAEIVKKEKVDEKAALKQADKVLARESALKREHLSLLIRVKNILSPKQMAKLDEVKKGPKPGPPPEERR